MIVRRHDRAYQNQMLLLVAVTVAIEHRQRGILARNCKHWCRCVDLRSSLVLSLLAATSRRAKPILVQKLPVMQAALIEYDLTVDTVREVSAPVLVLART